LTEIPEIFGSAISIGTDLTGDGNKKINAFIAVKVKEFNARDSIRECFEVFPVRGKKRREASRFGFYEGITIPIG
jgi:hypothetical protein